MTNKERRDAIAVQIAAAFVQGMTEAERTNTLDGYMGFARISRASYACADALIKEGREV